MTINEIKELAQKLKDADVEKIKEEIKSKEAILKNNDLDEEELGEVLNTLFSILVIEQAFEDEVEGVEEMRAELEQELMESYEKYDKHMAKYKKEKKEEKKKKRRWLLDFFALSEDIRHKKKDIGASNKLISRMQNQINELKRQSSNEKVKEACDHENHRGRDDWKKSCERCNDEFNRCRGEADGFKQGRGGHGHRNPVPENVRRPNNTTNIDTYRDALAGITRENQIEGVRDPLRSNLKRNAEKIETPEQDRERETKKR